MFSMHLEEMILAEKSKVKKKSKKNAEPPAVVALRELKNHLPVLAKILKHLTSQQALIFVFYQHLMAAEDKGDEPRAKFIKSLIKQALGACEQIVLAIMEAKE